jgi:hypothetical protein
MTFLILQLMDSPVDFQQVVNTHPAFSENVKPASR